MEAEERTVQLTGEHVLRQEDYRLLSAVYLEGYSVREAAEQLGISAEACKKRLQRARARLREALEGGEGDA